MPMDAVFLHGLTQELAQSLTGARIDKVQQPEKVFDGNISPS